VLLRHIDRRDRRVRFDVMLDVIERRADTSVVLCDLGCGTGELLTHIRERNLRHITYIGADRSAVALAHARAKFPDTTFVEIDVNTPGADFDRLSCDYLVANGMFIAKFELTYDQMWSFLISTIEQVWPKIRRGIAFNVMSKVVDRESDDLFHLPMDEAARLLHRLAGRRVRLRADYGLCEYTAYAYKPEPPNALLAAAALGRASGAVPALRPLLPRVDRLVPYLSRIDAARIYTNHGPLATEFGHRLESHLGLPRGGLACASSGTVGLIGAILATAGQPPAKRPFALMPAFTFVATAVAAERCGYQVCLADIDADTWMLDPGRLADHPALAQVGVVLAVAPFGRPVPQKAWLAFRERTGIPVVIDGAASFDRLAEAPEPYIGDIPVVLSFHATKSFGTGEGGGVASTNVDVVPLVVQALNFGFYSARDSQSASTNGKLSEYHAAVGLAELDGWTEKRAAMLTVIDCYRRCLNQAGLLDRFVGAPDIGLSYVLFQCRDATEAERVQAALWRSEVGTRLWYGTGLHRHPHFATRHFLENLTVTEAVAPRILGLPMAPDLSEPQIKRIVGIVAGSIEPWNVYNRKRKCLPATVAGRRVGI
jgi:dTDP-4-amino-4,6-dideoxygalactose transaminase